MNKPKTNDTFVMADNFRVLSVREAEDQKIITVGIVSERVDSYRTVIAPDGCISPLKSVPVDFNHNRIATGASLVDKGVQDIEIELNGKTQTIKSRVVDVIVPKNARMWTRDNKDKRSEDVPSLYENIENGRVSWVSVDFQPVKESIERVYNASKELIREEYKQWRLNFLSLLDTKPGQDDSYFLNVRKLNFNNRIMLKEIIDALTAALTAQEVELTGDVSGVNLNMTSDEAGTFEFMLGETKYSGNYKMEDGKFAVDGEVTAEAAAAAGEGEEKPKDERKPTEEEPKNGVQRAWVGDLIKNKEGKVALVTKKIVESTDGGNKCTLTATMLEDDSEITVDESEVAYEYESSEGVEKEWLYVNQGMAIMYMVNLLKGKQPEAPAAAAAPAEGAEATPEAARILELEKAVEENTRQLQEKSDTIKTLETERDNFKRLAKSPKEGAAKDSDAAGDLAGEGAEDKGKPTKRSYSEMKEESEVTKLPKVTNK